MAGMEGSNNGQLLERDSLGLSDSGFHRVLGLRDHDDFLAGAQEFGSSAGFVRRHVDRHPVLVRRSGRSLRLVVSASLVARRFPAQPGGSATACHRGGNRLVASPGPKVIRRDWAVGEVARADDTGALRNERLKLVG